MSKTVNIFSLIIFIAFLLCSTVYSQTDEKQQSFEWVFGDLVKLDKEMVQKVLNDTHGKRHYVDKDGDGKPEEVWFIDISPRHSADKRPILVRVVDENGNLRMGEEPDYAGYLYIADWNADHIQGDWLRAHQFPVAPGVREWKEKLTQTAVERK